eukprot:2921353-Pyramimonas_sp.AAC.1
MIHDASRALKRARVQSSPKSSTCFMNDECVTQLQRTHRRKTRRTSTLAEDSLSGYGAVSYTHLTLPTILLV